MPPSVTLEVRHLRKKIIGMLFFGKCVREREIRLISDPDIWNILPDSPEAVCLPGSKTAVPITQVVPVVFATVRLPDENGSPVRAGGVIHGRDETSPEACQPDHSSARPLL
ncbi:hypothetical protein TNIN_471501 [Trichonephila inaurata madagascariensis]|uniref:Uncharacterized protein n=1 Tax=Trichonephila inaurata madagascariensis TaxID=2747483 RepID=A0A8X6YXH8_9ARAC|nr:hypothetical protein TNIN_471501 [Trichonephila inaurata madagascariensis]